jgi:hypothetical protein
VACERRTATEQRRPAGTSPEEGPRIETRLDSTRSWENGELNRGYKEVTRVTEAGPRRPWRTAHKAHDGDGAERLGCKKEKKEVVSSP